MTDATEPTPARCRARGEPLLIQHLYADDGCPCADQPSVDRSCGEV